MKPWVHCLLCTTVLLVSGCISVNSYVEPGHALVGLKDIRSSAKPLPVNLHVEFLRNGTAIPENNAHLRKLVSNTLYSTGVLQVVHADQAQATFKVTVDNRYDHGEALSQGILAGLSEGLFGRTVIDHYVFTMVLHGPHQPMRRGVYDDVIETTLGRAKAPVAAQVNAPSDAYDVVVDQAVLNFLSDLQAAGDSPMPIGFVHRADAPGADGRPPQ